jgi:hypothetical protein
VRASFLQSLKSWSDPGRAPTLIFVGLAILLASAWWTVLPVVTAMALVALGATGAAMRRSQGSRSSFAVVAAHFFVYLNLYFLFAGAVCHAAIQADGLTILIGLDLGLSVLPMAILVQRSVSAMGRSEDAPAR